MTEAAAMLRDIGMEPLMTEAAARRISWGAEQGLAPGLVDDGFPTVEALEKAFGRKTRKAEYRCGVYQREETAKSEEHTSELQSLIRISYDVYSQEKKQHDPKQPPSSQ